MGIGTDRMRGTINVDEVFTRGMSMTPVSLWASTLKFSAMLVTMIAWDVRYLLEGDEDVGEPAYRRRLGVGCACFLRHYWYATFTQQPASLRL